MADLEQSELEQRIRDKEANAALLSPEEDRRWRWGIDWAVQLGELWTLELRGKTEKEPGARQDWGTAKEQLDRIQRLLGAGENDDLAQRVKRLVQEAAVSLV